MIPFLFVVAITVATLVIGLLASRGAKTAADMMVAGRSVGVGLNAAAISGEYLSAASFMGIAGLVMKNGFDALWYPVGYAAGYLFLLLFIAGPLRRFGAYTIPDFAEGRFDSPRFRRIAVLFVLGIGFFYTMPQMKGAGVTMGTILGWPYWAGIAIVGSVITFNVAVGGMKGITLVQAFQYWAKLFAISVPIFVIVSVTGVGKAVPRDEPVVWSERVPETVTVKGSDGAPNNVVTGSAVDSVQLRFDSGAKIAKVSYVPAPKPGELIDSRNGMEFINYPQASDRVTGLNFYDDGRRGPVEGLARKGFALGPKSHLQLVPVRRLVKDDKALREIGYSAVKLEFAEKTQMTLVRGPMPNQPAEEKWRNPFGPLTQKHGYPLLYTYSLIIALVCGTAGLPHILVRFYTNPDGKSARRTAFWTMVLLGAFYVFTPIWGTLGRALLPILYANNTTDSVVIRLPAAVIPGVWGEVLTGVTAAGAFAAFMSTFSGLLVSMSGAFAHDVYGTMIRPSASPESRKRAFQIAAIVIGAVAMLLGLLVESFDIATMVGWAFAIGAASYFPLLLLGTWWRGLSATGATAGMLLGGLASLAAIVSSMLLDKKIFTFEVSPLIRSLMEQPAIWGVPLSILTMIVVSKLGQPPADVTGKMLRLHQPEVKTTETS